MKEINNAIAVASGKGGVGKSSTAVMMALSMKEMGLKVGLLDADTVSYTHLTLPTTLPV